MAHSILSSHRSRNSVFLFSTEDPLRRDLHKNTSFVKKKIGFDGWKQDFRTATYLGCELTLSPFDQAAAEP